MKDNDFVLRMTKKDIKKYEKEEKKRKLFLDGTSKIKAKFSVGENNDNQSCFIEGNTCFKIKSGRD